MSPDPLTPKARWLEGRWACRVSGTTILIRARTGAAYRTAARRLIEAGIFTPLDPIPGGPLGGSDD